MSRIYIFLKLNNKKQTTQLKKKRLRTWINISPKISKQPISIWKDTQHH